MKKIAFLLATALSATAVFAQNNTIENYSQTDSVSYANGVYHGVNIAHYCKENDIEFNIAAHAAGMKDAFDGNIKMTQKEASEFMDDFFMNKLPARNLARANEFMAKAEQEPGIQKTESGLLYRIDNEGDITRWPNIRDEVTVSYVGTLADGTEFDRSDSVSFKLINVISGFQEGAQMIGKGGKIHLIIPPALGYGSKGTGQRKIPANAVLIFDIELLDIVGIEVHEIGGYDPEPDSYVADGRGKDGGKKARKNKKGRR